MALLFNEEQQYLKDTAKEFVQKNAPITHFRELRDSEDETGYSQEPVSYTHLTLPTSDLV